MTTKGTKGQGGTTQPYNPAMFATQQAGAQNNLMTTPYQPQRQAPVMQPAADYGPGKSAPTMTATAAMQGGAPGQQGAPRATYSDALSRMYSGQIDNPYLDQQAQNITNMATRNFQEQVAPSIRAGSQMSGGFGGSRQGIAEGLAMSRMNQDLGSSLTNLYGSAYENAQNRMGQAALQEAGFANQASMQQANLSAQQAMQQKQLEQQRYGMDQNYDLTRRGQANQFALGDRSQTLEEQRFGASLLPMANQQYMNGLGQLGSIGQQQFNAPWQALQNYAGIVMPGSQLGSTQSKTEPSDQGNPLGQGIGTDLGMMQLYKMFSDRRLKTDIKRVGTTDDGLGVYTYRYKAGGPVQMGVMADEVKKIKPHAVEAVGGFDTVDYGAL